MVHSILKVSLNVSEGLEQLQRKGQLPKYLAWTQPKMYTLPVGLYKALKAYAYLRINGEA